MKIFRYDIYSADLNPRIGTEPGKVRPVVVIQTDLLNEFHPSTIICPITSKVANEAEILRVHLSNKNNGLKVKSDILVDQVRAIDNHRFKELIGKLTDVQIDQLKSNLKILLID